MYMPISLLFDSPAIASIAMYARPHIAIHHNCISVKIKRAFTVLNILS